MLGDPSSLACIGSRFGRLFAEDLAEYLTGKCRAWRVELGPIVDPLSLAVSEMSSIAGRFCRGVSLRGRPIPWNQIDVDGVKWSSLFYPSGMF